MNTVIAFSVDIDDRVIERIRGLPRALQAELEPELDDAGEHVAQEMKLAAPAGVTSKLINSIKMDREAAMSRWIGPHAAYATAVEFGTGPARGRKSYFPNVDNLEEYVQRRAGISFRNTKKGSLARRHQKDEISARAWQLAVYIYRVGTRPQPFVQPTAKKTAPRVSEILKGGVERVIAKAGLQA